MDILQKFDDDSIYYADREYLSNSSLKLLKESPTKFYLWMNNKWKQKEIPAFQVGRALHARFLEEKDSYIGWDGQRRGDEYKNFCKENPETIVLTKAEASIVDGMYDKLSKVDAVKNIMGLTFRPEVPAVMEYETESGNIVKLKGKADALAFDGERDYLVDLKTTKDPMSKWKKNAIWNYAQQAYMYKTMFQVQEFYFLVVQKEFPFDVGIYKVSDQFFEKGRREFIESINLYEKLFINGEYKPYSADLDIL